MREVKSLLSLLTLLLSAAAVRGAESQTLELASPFLDRAILQREMGVPVWGWAKPDTIVTVSFAGQSKTAKADAKGQWKLKLDPLRASAEGRELSVTASDGESLKLQDILVGEVWFSSGQSNMDWVASKSMCRDLAQKMQAGGPGARIQRRYGVRRLRLFESRIGG